MSSVIDYKKCPRCGGVLYTEFNCRTYEEFSVCNRCGINYTTEGEKPAFGRCLIYSKKGIGHSFSFAEPIDRKIKKWYSKLMKDKNIDPDRSYLMAWDPEKKEVVPIFGNDPGLYEEEF